jgi:hypothetical protein
LLRVFFYLVYTSKDTVVDELSDSVFIFLEHLAHS